LCGASQIVGQRAAGSRTSMNFWAHREPLLHAYRLVPAVPGRVPKPLRRGACPV
jgi:hypothetical protein